MKTQLYIILHQPKEDYLKVAEICVQHKIKYLQLREKEMPDRDFFNLSNDIKSITRDSSTEFIINDRVDISILSESDGLHLGQEDLPIDEAKKILTKNQTIGLSTHNLEQVKKANLLDLDYIGFGPVFPTNIKKNPDPVTGLNMLKEALKISKHPIVAIGGIKDYNLNEILKLNPAYVAMVSFFMQANDLTKRIKLIQKMIDEFGEKNDNY